MNKDDPQNNDISLDLSLGLHPQAQAKDHVDEQGPFMQLLRSVSDAPPNCQPSNSLLHMTPPAYYVNPWNGAALPFGVVSVAAPSPYLPSGQVLHQPLEETVGPVRPSGHQARRNTSRAAAAVDKEIVPPYPWATTRVAVIHTLGYLISKNIKMISGQVHCRPCDRTQTLEYNLEEKFAELHEYINENKEALRQRAPTMWMTPKLTPCGLCENGMKPVIGENKEEINWLFLLLGKMLGCCTLEQLRYFCDKTYQHRTGAKDRVLYITYLGLCKQLHPDGPFSL